MEQEKKADNKIEKNKKKKLEEKLDNERDLLKRLDGIEEEITSLKKNIDKCISLIGESIKGGNIQNVLESMLHDNNEYLFDTTEIIEQERKSSQKRINKIKEDMRKKE